MAKKIERNLEKAGQTLKDAAKQQVAVVAGNAVESGVSNSEEEETPDEATSGMFATVSLVSERVNSNYVTTARPPSVVNMSMVSLYNHLLCCMSVMIMIYALF